jgi:hypothetical protein
MIECSFGNFKAGSVIPSSAIRTVFHGERHNQRLKRTGCKSGSAHEKSREESALFVLNLAPVPAF